MDTQQQISDLLAAFGQALATFSPEAIARLYDKKGQFIIEAGAIAAKLSQPEPVTPSRPPTHETIRIKVTIGGRDYLACGFLRDKESSVGGQTMLDRTEVEGTKPIDDEDWGHLYRHRADFPSEFQGKYYLVTARRIPGFPRDLSCFDWRGRQWCENSNSVGRQWGDGGLVLRRCT